MSLTVIPTHATTGPDGEVIATTVPAGFWEVMVIEVRRSQGLFIAYAVPVTEQSEASFALAVGDHYPDVARSAREWATSANTLAMSFDRVRHVGRVY